MAANTDFFVVRKGATAVPNGLVHNKKLSWASLGLIVYCLSLPTGARVGYRELQGRGLGEKATRKALVELEELPPASRSTNTTRDDSPLTVGPAMTKEERQKVLEETAEMRAELTKKLAALRP